MAEVEAGYYLHFKGGIYDVLHTETDDSGTEVVVYKDSKGEEHRRNAGEFMDTVGSVYNGVSTLEPRFRKLRLDADLLPSMSEDSKRDLLAMMQRHLGIKPLKNTEVIKL